MSDFILGVLGSTVAAILIYVFRYYIGYVVNLIFFRVYPNIEGDYNVYPYDCSPDFSDEDDDDYESDETIPNHKDTEEFLEYLKSDTESDIYIKAKFKQFAFKVKGSITTTEKGIVIEVEKIYGKILPSRVILLNSETKTSDHHNYGTMLLRMTQNNSIIKGTRSFLCIKCGDAASDFVMFERIK